MSSAATAPIRHLPEREHVHEVEEQLERGDPVAFAGGAQAEQRTADRCGHRPSLRCGDLTWAPRQRQLLRKPGQPPEPTVACASFPP